MSLVNQRNCHGTEPKELAFYLRQAASWFEQLDKRGANDARLSKVKI